MDDPTNRCPDCDAPLATEEMHDAHPEGCECAECESVCWRVWNWSCIRPHINWRSEALALRERLKAIEVALGKERTAFKFSSASPGIAAHTAGYVDGLTKAIKIVEEVTRG